MFKVDNKDTRKDINGRRPGVFNVKFEYNASDENLVAIELQKWKEIKSNRYELCHLVNNRKFYVSWNALLTLINVTHKTSVELIIYYQISEMTMTWRMSELILFKKHTFLSKKCHFQNIKR